MKRILLFAALIIAASCGVRPSAAAVNAPETGNAPAKVYFIPDVSSAALVQSYKALGRAATGKVAVKISTGEAGNDNYLHPELIAGLLKEVKGKIVECNTAYGGSRQDPALHDKTIEEHGFNKVGGVDLMDRDGEVSIPVPEGSVVLKDDIVGKNMLNYDFMVVLSHFKGHAMGGFGGALKNLSIGCASTNGKAYIHTGGKDRTLQADTWSDKKLAGLDEFKDAMAEAAGAVVNHFGEKILYINVIYRLSVDCDCDSHPAAPQMKDIGIAASLDPVALDQACVDMIFNSDDPGNRHMVERIVSRHGTRILYWAQHLGYGSRDYELVKL